MIQSTHQDLVVSKKSIYFKSNQSLMAEWSKTSQRYVMFCSYMFYDPKGHGFKPWLDRTCTMQFFCSKSNLNQIHPINERINQSINQCLTNIQTTPDRTGSKNKKSGGKRMRSPGTTSTLSLTGQRDPNIELLMTIHWLKNFAIDEWNVENTCTIVSVTDINSYSASCDNWCTGTLLKTG